MRPPSDSPDYMIKDLSFAYGDPEFGGERILEEISCRFKAGEIAVFLGPSGCGKTTLLRLLSGLLTPDSGTLGREADAPPFRWSYLFQEPRLLPWRRVGQNIDIVLAGSGPVTPAIQRRRQAFLEMVELGDAADAYPRELSGGMRQRAAMARAFAWGGDGLLLDEPFQALDLRLKRSLIASFHRLWAVETGVSPAAPGNPSVPENSAAPGNPAARREGRRGPAVLVTHDLPEALLLGDVIRLLSAKPGRIVGEWRNPLPPGERRLGHPALMELEGELYKELLS